jgi:MarR family transcriptional regulator, negative regulator of the multidrug operon emrRAB
VSDSAANGKLDFWTFIELAKSRLGSEFGSVGQQATEVLLTLNRASMVVTYDLESAVHRPQGLSWSSFRLLFVVWLAGPLEPKKAAELAGVTKAAVSNLAKSLIDAELLTRTPADRDGRSVQLALTEEGQRQIHALFQKQNERERAWVAALTPAEQHILVLLLNKLITGRTDFDVRTRS